jgi:acetylornithine deacetylase/succinyl-diaminopimelate desuccinylase-like protein
MATELIKKYVDSAYDKALPVLSSYIEIPNVSPFFDKEWEKNGLINKAMCLLHDWVSKQNVHGLTSKIIKHDGRTPLMYCEITPEKYTKTILMYGHMDKQPPLDKWSEGLGPYTPVLKDGKLYGRGGADDGYAIFSCIIAIKALQENKLPYPKIIIMIEASEESGSPDLLYYVESLKIPAPDLVICLDSGCEDYERLWMTMSLRGLVSGVLEIKTLTTSVHSGDGGGAIPNCFDIMRTLLDRVADSKTGDMSSDFYKSAPMVEATCKIPGKQIKYSQQMVQLLGKDLFDRHHFYGTTSITRDADEQKLLYYNLRRSWGLNLAVVGIDGMPSVENGGNVIHPGLRVSLSMRLPPNLDPEKASLALKTMLEVDPPYGCYTKFTVGSLGSGWVAHQSDALEKLVSGASDVVFGKPASHLSEGGSIPFIKMLGKMFPKAEFMICGVLGPGSNAHSTDEFLDIGYVKKLTTCVSMVMADYK